MIPGGIPRPGRMPTANQQRVMMEKLSQVDNSVRSTNGSTAASVSPDGIAVRDYEPQRILGKITGHGTGNRYSFVQVIQTDQTGTVATLTGGVTGSTTVLSAYEMNGLTTVPNDAIVELVPTWGANPGYGFIYNGVDTSSGTLADAAVHVTATSGGTYTVKRVNRDSGGTLVESSPTVTYTGVYEAQGRTAVVDPTSTPTHELPLFIDKNGKYYFQIDQYAASSQVGLVSATTQTFTGNKTFEGFVEVSSSRGTGIPFKIDSQSKISYGYTAQFSDGTTDIDSISIPFAIQGLAIGDPDYTTMTGIFNTAIDGRLIVYNDIRFVTTNNTVPVALYGDDDNAGNIYLSTILQGTYNACTSKFESYDSATNSVARLSVTSGAGVGYAFFNCDGFDGINQTLTFGGGVTGDVATMTVRGGIITAVTLVP